MGDSKKAHSDCLRCFGCNTSLQRYILKDNEYYCTTCADVLFTPKCVLCNDSLGGKRYYQHAFFQGKGGYCQKHQGTARQCFSCHQLEPCRDSRKELFASLPDGRAMCGECISTAVFDSSEARPLYLQAVDFMEFMLGLPIPNGMREVPVLAVDLPSLNEQHQLNSFSPHPMSEGEVSPRTNYCSSVTRGLTISSKGIVRHMSPGSMQWIAGVGWTMSSPSFTTLSETRSVTAVLVLCCLPRDLTASILAHEAMHVWCKLRSDMPFELPSRVEEGVCQLISHKFLEHVIEAYPFNGWESQLQLYYKNLIETDPSPVYGDGFRDAAAYCSCSEGNLSSLIQKIKQTRNIPNLIRK